MFFVDCIEKLLQHLSSLPDKGCYGSFLPYKVQPSKEVMETIAKGGREGIFWWLGEGKGYYEERPFRIYWIAKFSPEPTFLGRNFCIKFSYATFMDILVQSPGFSYWRVNSLTGERKEIREIDKPVLPVSRKFIRLTSDTLMSQQPFGHLPTIVLGPETTYQDVAAQVCFYALRLKFGEERMQKAMLDYLEDYLENKLRSHNFAHDIALKLVYDVNYRHPLTSRSFLSYAKAVLHEMKRQRKISASFPQTSLRVDGLSAAFDIPRSTLYRWIKEGKINALFREHVGVVKGVTGIAGEKKRNEYHLDDAVIKAAVTLFAERERKKELVRLVAEYRKCTLKAAREWIRRRKKKGLKEENIYRELIIETQKNNGQ